MPYHNPGARYKTGPGIEPGTFGVVDECSTTELTHLPDTPTLLSQQLQGSHRKHIFSCLFHDHFLIFHDHLSAQILHLGHLAKKGRKCSLNHTKFVNVKKKCTNWVKLESKIGKVP